jgi:hypothetical protein
LNERADQKVEKNPPETITKTLEKKRLSFNQDGTTMGTNLPFPHEDIFGCKKSLLLRKAEVYKNIP